MKKYLPFIFAAVCLAALTQCDIWNQPLVEPIQDRVDELNSIYTIYVTKYLRITEFGPGKIPEGSSEWADLGLEISGINGMEKTRVLGPEEYSIVAPLDAPDPESGEVTVNVKYNDTHRYPDVSTAFTVMVINGFEIAWSRDHNGNFVYPEPAIITEKDFAADGSGASVEVNIFPAAGYEYIEDSLYYTTTDPPPPQQNPSGFS